MAAAAAAIFTLQNSPRVPPLQPVPWGFVKLNCGVQRYSTPMSYKGVWDLRIEENVSTWNTHFTTLGNNIFLFSYYVFFMISKYNLRKTFFPKVRECNIPFQ